MAFWAFSGTAHAQNFTLTITNNGPNSGAVGVQPGGNVCNPNPGGGGGGAPCTFSYPAGTFLRLMANSPSTPGIFNNGSGSAASCGTSVCEFFINSDSAITATFDPALGPFPSLTINLQGDARGNVGTDNNMCQNYELGFTACTTFYGAGSAAIALGRSLPGMIFGGFSGGTGDAAACGGTAPCSFTLSSNSSVNATFSALSSVAIEPPSTSINVGGNAFFNARATFTNGMTRLSFNGNSPWNNHVPMDVARFSLASAVVDDRLYALGGVDGSCVGPCGFGPLSTVEMFNPTINLIAQFNQVWTPRASMTMARESLAAAVVNGKIYAIGGHTSGGGTVASMEFYDPVANTWAAGASMSAPRANMAAATIGNIIYVVGGDPSAGGDPPNPLTTVEAYDATTNTWTTKTPMLTARRFPAAAAVNGTLYVIGGDGAGTVEAYNPATDSWTMKASMPNGGGSHEAAALNGLIYAVGGSPVSVKVYNPALDAWVTLTSPNPLPMSGQFALAVLDGRLFAAGGNLADNTAMATLSANRPPEATWWSSNSAVGRINNGNNGSVNGVSVGTATISARLVTVDSGAQSALLTVNPAGGGPGQIFLGIPNQAFTDVGNPNWGCGTFSQNNSTGPWEVKINYGDGSGDQLTPYSPPPGPCGGGPGTKGFFLFNHAYASPGTFHVTVTVRNTSTNQQTIGGFDVQVQEGGGGGGDDCAQVIANISVIGTVPFDRVQVAVFDRTTNDLLFEGELPIGFFDDAALPEGQYRIEFSVPAGYMVTPSSFSVDAVCGEAIHLDATVQAIPPSLTVALSPNVIWPPNHKMVPITATITASAPGGHATTVTLVSITNNESSTADVGGAAFGTDDRAFEVRATRSGGGSGRIYTVTYRVTDTVTGLSTTATATVVVPHDQGK